ncbi:MAG: zinc ribbon domain-containing protein [Eubacterium sp.]|nr:zinc ribbon domain-containing protein [Eubacterium sp.]
MDFFERLGDTIVNVSRDVTQKAKDVSGIAKLKLDMKAKEDFIKEQYAALGKWYYQEHKEEEGEQKAWIEHIDEALEAIAQMELKILELKKARVCQECGAQASDTAEYCSVCGAKLVVVVKEDVPEADAATEEPKEEIKDDDLQIP